MCPIHFELHGAKWNSLQRSCNTYFSKACPFAQKCHGLCKSVLVVPPALEQRFGYDVSMGRIPLIFFVLGEFGRFGSPTINSSWNNMKKELEIDLVSDSSCKKACLRIAMSKGKQSWDFRTFKIHKVEAMRHLRTLPTVPAMSVEKRTLVPV